MKKFIFKGQSLKELFLLLTEEDVKQIVMRLYNVESEKAQNWRISKHEDLYQICVSDIESDEELHPDNSTVIVLNDELDIYQQSFLPKRSKLRVGNLFATYHFMLELFAKKLEKN